MNPCRHCGREPIITRDVVSKGAYIHTISCYNNEYYQGKNISFRCHMGDDITIRTTTSDIGELLVNLWNGLNPTCDVLKDYNALKRYEAKDEYS